MLHMAGARLLFRLYSKACSGMIQTCNHHSPMNSFIRRYAGGKIPRPSTLNRQTPRRAPVFKLTGFFEGGYILLIFPATFLWLGTWQVKRRRWKLDLLDKIEARTQAPPVPLPTNLDELENLEYTRVVVRGKFDFSKEAIIAPRSQLSDDPTIDMRKTRVPGLHIVTPFKLADRDLTIMVNRGWLSRQQFQDLKYRRIGQEEGEIEMVGLVRLTDKPSWIQKTPFKFEVECPSNETLFLQRDVPAMAEELKTAPVFLDATEIPAVSNVCSPADLKINIPALSASTFPKVRLKPGAPLGGQTNINLSNNHGTYVLTWYSLAVLTTWMWLERYRKSVAPRDASQVFQMLKRWK